MSKMLLSFSHVSFGYDSSLRNVIDDFTGSFSRGWTGIVGPNGAGKTTLLLLAGGRLKPLSGEISEPEDFYYCVQRTDDAPDELEHLISCYDSDAAVLKGILGIEEHYPDAWDVLSHGERKRAQLAVALWKEPGVLALDEPTNHIDSETKRMIGDALSRYAGIGLLVSHDRELLDRLCIDTVYIDPPNIFVKPGGYTKAYEQIRLDRMTIARQETKEKKEASKLKKELHKRRMRAEAADRAKSKKGISAKDSDAKEKIDRGRVTGKDGKISGQSKSIETRLRQTQEKSAGLRVKKDQVTGISIDGVKTKRDVIYKTAAGRIPMNEERRLTFPDLEIRPDDRIALCGPNGCGKSTLITKITGELKLAADEFIYIPQEISAAEAAALIDETRALPSGPLGDLMTIVSRLNSRPERLLDTHTPSPGEARKLLLALGLLKNPCLIIMDEPTNHLDIVSIQCIEEALSSCEAALLLVSHDARFLKKLTVTTWRISRDNSNPDGNTFLAEE